ncbi:glutamate receptor 2.9-like [Neltuma alba]|uniref:glutamate receptor 2.9-like n=1 Tax=Neltuma alba TaxID=207710 RepID=UPI0010A34C42|nr:glutamate receptor 2.9-like [Prosopis alba]
MAKSLKCLLFWLLLQLLLLQNSQTVNGSPNLLRIGVPKKDGFTQFVKVRWEPRENKYKVSGGYCIDVFNAVIKHLPFKVSPEFIPYVNQTGQSAGTYDSLIQQIPEKYDAVVGDVTIVANRSRFVDFTLPYTETGVSMIVTAKHGRHRTMWIFVKPFSWGLWLSIAIASISIGFVISIMERNVNNLPERGSQTTSPKQLNVVTILWFPLLQAVLPDREVVVKSCSRFVLMVWLLLAFVLMQSYTASLTTILTVDQLQPSFLNVNDLRKGGYYVGYQANSFVRDLLVNRLKLDPSKLRAYDNLSEYHQALSKGSQGGGVAAIFDEIPFLKLYLNKFGSNYVMAGPTYRADGFGFAFQLGSNLTSHFSRAILNVTESDIMDRIQKKYFGDDDNGRVQDQTGQVSSTTTTNLTFHSFQGLFLVTGIATVLALIVSESVIWQKPISMARAYSEKYLFGSTPTRSRDNTVHPSSDSPAAIDTSASDSPDGNR